MSLKVKRINTTEEEVEWKLSYNIYSTILRRVLSTIIKKLKHVTR